MKKITADDILKVLSKTYELSKTGIPHVSPPIEKIAASYLKKYPDKKLACKKMLSAQIAKCTTSGIITGFGGLITMPVTVPANISSVLYVQMRMIACAACIAGYDLDDDEVQTFVYACLAGVSIGSVVKKFGVNFGQKLALVGIRKIPGAVLIKINQRIGFRLLTKFGEKGLINLGKMVPLVGALINGSFDMAETKIMAVRAYKMFIEHNFDVGSSYIDIDVSKETEESTVDGDASDGYNSDSEIEDLQNDTKNDENSDNT